MTRQHFEFVASLINAANKGVAPEHLATLAATKFAKDNPRFDKDKFLDACGNPLSPPPATIEVRDGDYWEGLVQRASAK